MQPFDPATFDSCRGCVDFDASRRDAMQPNATCQVELKLKTPWRDGTTHLVMSPLESMQRLAALVPLPRLHLSLSVPPNARLARAGGRGGDHR